MSQQDYANWMAEENAYTTHERPWEHADLVAYGGQSLAYDQENEVVLATPFKRPDRTHQD
jgi:hypothetical protein